MLHESATSPDHQRYVSYLLVFLLADRVPDKFLARLFVLLKEFQTDRGDNFFLIEKVCNQIEDSLSHRLLHLSRYHPMEIPMFGHHSLPQRFLLYKEDKKCNPFE